MTAPLRLVVMASGNGSNLQAILDAIVVGNLPAEVCAVISDKESSFALERAREAGIRAVFFPARRFAKEGWSREDRDVMLADIVAAYAPDLVVLAGWMLILTSSFLDRFGNVINLHPALPGTFPGTESIRRAHEAFVCGETDRSGVMVHYVIPEVDAGKVIVSEEIIFAKGESLEEFEARVHGVEHRLIVEAIRRVQSELKDEKSARLV
jgi:formyltetrahydrofolate-dependent phosphoribosylglycinamide formyltransferase